MLSSMAGTIPRSAKSDQVPRMIQSATATHSFGQDVGRFTMAASNAAQLAMAWTPETVQKFWVDDLHFGFSTTPP